MLAAFRTVLLLSLFVLWSIIGLIIGILRPRHPENTYIMANRLLSLAAPIMGFKIHIEGEELVKDIKTGIYAGIHQSNWDIVFQAKCMRKGVVTVGKKSLLWVPLFGFVYYLAGNILLDRANARHAVGTIKKVASEIRDRGLSVWMFPEGHRSLGKGLAPFKTGVVYLAAEAGCPVIPVVSSSYFSNIRLGRWNNGHIVLRYLEPRVYEKFESNRDAKAAAKALHDEMKAAQDELTARADALNAEEGIDPVGTGASEAAPEAKAPEAVPDVKTAPSAEPAAAGEEPSAVKDPSSGAGPSSGDR